MTPSIPPGPPVPEHHIREATENSLEPMPVGELSRRTGVSTATVNYYVRMGLLPRPRKTGQTRALYAPDFVERIQRIKQLQADGFPLRVIRRMLDEPGALSRPARQSSRQVPGNLSVGTFLEESGLSDDAYDVLLEAGLLRQPRRTGTGALIHDRRDLAAGRAFARLLSLGISAQIIARHGEYAPLARAEAHFLAEHIAAAARGGNPSAQAAVVVAAFDSVRRYLRLAELESAYPGWLASQDQ